MCLHPNIQSEEPLAKLCSDGTKSRRQTLTNVYLVTGVRASDTPSGRLWSVDLVRFTDDSTSVAVCGQSCPRCRSEGAQGSIGSAAEVESVSSAAAPTGPPSAPRCQTAGGTAPWRDLACSAHAAPPGESPCRAHQKRASEEARLPIKELSDQKKLTATMTTKWSLHHAGSEVSPCERERASEKGKHLHQPVLRELHMSGAVNARQIRRRKVRHDRGSS